MKVTILLCAFFSQLQSALGFVTLVDCNKYRYQSKNPAIVIKVLRRKEGNKWRREIILALGCVVVLLLQMAGIDRDKLVLNKRYDIFILLVECILSATIWTGATLSDQSIRNACLYPSHVLSLVHNSIDLLLLYQCHNRLSYTSRVINPCVNNDAGPIIQLFERHRCVARSKIWDIASLHNICTNICTSQANSRLIHLSIPTSYNIFAHKGPHHRNDDLYWPMRSVNGVNYWYFSFDAILCNQLVRSSQRVGGLNDNIKD